MKRPGSDLLVEHVLRVVEQVPSGRVISYGDVARIVGCGPRQVGAVMRHYGENVAWWRVVNAAGDLSVLDEARSHWQAEGIPLKPNGSGCRISDCRADVLSVAIRYRVAAADLAPLSTTGHSNPEVADRGR